MAFLNTFTLLQSGPTTRLKNTHLRCALFPAERTNLRVWFHSHALVDYIIDTAGSWLREGVPLLMQDLFRN